MIVPVSDLPVMKASCKTCPFRIVNGKEQDISLMNNVTERTLFKAQQICHHNHPSETHRCFGSYTHNKIIYDRMGYGHLLK